MLSDFLAVFGLLVVGAGMLVGILYVAKLIRPNNPQPQKYETYECGEEIEGPSWIQFNIRFYVVALIFIIFDVEIIFMFPWAVVFRQLGWFGLIEMLVFIVVLLVGLAYVWRRGDLQWVRLQLPYGIGRYAHQSLGTIEERAEEVV